MRMPDQHAAMMELCLSVINVQKSLGAFTKKYINNGECNVFRLADGGDVM